METRSEPHALILSWHMIGLSICFRGDFWSRIYSSHLLPDESMRYAACTTHKSRAQIIRYQVYDYVSYYSVLNELCLCTTVHVKRRQMHSLSWWCLGNVHLQIHPDWRSSSIYPGKNHPIHFYDFFS